MKAVGGDDLLLGWSRDHLRPRQRSARECSGKNSGRVCGWGWLDQRSKAEEAEWKQQRHTRPRGKAREVTALSSQEWPGEGLVSEADD
jgi:hypothetical protein